MIIANILLSILFIGIVVEGHPGYGYYYNQYITKKNTHDKVLRMKLPSWKPKTQVYNPEKVDWQSVITGCQATCRFDRRLCNFYIRAAAHDSLSISEGYGGADGSLLLTEDEIKRSENNYDNFAFLLSKNALALAQKFDTSVADIIAVCGAVAVEFQGGPKIIKFDSVEPFLVGRYDKTEPNPARSLAPANMNTTGFEKFAISRGFTIDEMTALMGSHSLLDEKGCLMANNKYCNPKKSPCNNIMMYQWSNIYYRETCTGKNTINVPKARSTLPLQTREFIAQQEMCRFTSPELRQRNMDKFNKEVPDVGNPNVLVKGEDFEYEDVTWRVNNVTRKWGYTIHDAWMGQACQGGLQKTMINEQIRISMNKFRTQSWEWDRVFIRAYKKMINLGATWYKNGGYAISGLECPSGYISDVISALCFRCSFKNEMKNYKSDCPPTCRCITSFYNTDHFYY